MTATNHALTGAVIGLAVGQPFIALPAALASHYVCDALPHYGTNLPMEKLFKTRAFRDYLVAEALICALLVGLLALTRPQYWLLAAVCAFVAAAPDLMSINRYVTMRSGKPWKASWYSRFAIRIQWFERPIGAVVEVAWFAAAVTLLAVLIRR